MNSKTAIVTGASRGIGKEIARTFATEGYNVVINYNNSKKEAEELQKELTEAGCSCRIFKCDVTSFNEAKALTEFTLKEFGCLDVLVNNAGISEIKLFTDITPDDWNRMMNTNVNGVFNCTHHAVKEMIKQKNGCIINVSSMWGQVGASCEVHYSTAKAAVIGMTKALAKELGLSNVRVNCIAPGVIETDMMKGFTKDELDMLREEIPLNRFGTPKDVADLALFLASDKAKNITGQILSTNGGMVI